MKGWKVTAVFEVEVTYKWAGWSVVASWPQRWRRTDIASTVVVHRNKRLILAPTRFNLISSTAKTTLTKFLGGESEFVNKVCADLIDRYRQAGETVTPTPQQRTTDRWLLYPVWPASGGTLVAAGTNSFKSLLACAAAVQVALGHEILAGNTRAPEARPVLFADWEGTQPDFEERLYAVLMGAGLEAEPCVAYRHLRVPLVDAADALAEEVSRHDYAGVIVDSLSAAAGGSLVDDELANQFWGAIAYLNVPALVMAHKSQEAISRNRKRAFGSVMHENRSRMLWDAVRTGALVRWEVVSDNNTGRQGNLLAWEVDIVTEGDDHLERLASLSFQGVNPHDVELAAREGDTLADRMAYALLASGPMTAKELASAVGTSEGSARNQLNRHEDTFEHAPDGVRWRLRE